MGWFEKKDKSLGIAREKRRYDLPLNKSGSGTRFLVVLIGLMSFLAVLALASSFALSAMTERWSAGLENSATIEITAKDETGKMITKERLKSHVSRTAALLKNHPAVSNVRIMSDDEIAEMIRPWLGQTDFLKEVPLPGLIEIKLTNSEQDTLTSISGKIKSVTPMARLDTHEDWLKDLVRFTGALQFAALLLTGIIAMITVTAVAGAVKSRMAVYNDEVELLHLIGAADRYIAKQFQRHSVILAMQGSFAGLVAGAISLFIIGWISGEMGVNLLPDFRISIPQYFILAAVPLIVAVIATFTARQTVMKVLEDMP